MDYLRTLSKNQLRGLEPIPRDKRDIVESLGLKVTGTNSIYKSEYPKIQKLLMSGEETKEEKYTKIPIETNIEGGQSPPASFGCEGEINEEEYIKLISPPQVKMPEEKVDISSESEEDSSSEESSEEESEDSSSEEEYSKPIRKRGGGKSKSRRREEEEEESEGEITESQKKKLPSIIYVGSDKRRSKDKHRDKRSDKKKRKEKREVGVDTEELVRLLEKRITKSLKKSLLEESKAKTKQKKEKRKEKVNKPKEEKVGKAHPHPLDAKEVATEVESKVAEEKVGKAHPQPKPKTGFLSFGMGSRRRR